MAKSKKEIFIDALNKEDCSIYDTIPYRFLKNKEVEDIISFHQKIGFHAFYPYPHMLEKIGYRKIEKIIEKNNIDIALLGSIDGPFTSFTTSKKAGIIKFDSKLFYSAKNNPKIYSEVLEVYTKDYLFEIIDRQQEYIDALLVVEPNASLLSEEEFKILVKPALKRICNKSDKPVILHIPGNISQIYKNCKDIGISAIQPFDRHMTNNSHIQEIIEDIGHIAVVGNVPCDLFESGNRNDIFNESYKCLELGVDVLHSDYFLSLRKDVTIEAINSMVSAYNTFRKDRI